MFRMAAIRKLNNIAVAPEITAKRAVMLKAIIEPAAVRIIKEIIPIINV